MSIVNGLQPSRADHADAARIATGAGELLLKIRGSLAYAGVNADEVRKEGDVRSHAYITTALAAARPADSVLSEEGVQDASRLRSRRVWIVDPLDGTREFGEPDRADWAVHVALVIDGSPVAAAVALPARALTLATSPRSVVPARPPRRPRLLVSRTRPAELSVEIAEQLGADLVPMGSAGAKTMAVVLGEADVYMHAGGQYEWDSAAPVAVAAAAGLHVSRLDGSALRYNRRDPWLPDLLVCRPELKDAVGRALAAVGWAADGSQSLEEGR